MSRSNKLSSPRRKLRADEEHEHRHGLLPRQIARKRPQRENLLHVRADVLVISARKPKENRSQKERVARLSPFVSTPQAVWIACNVAHENGYLEMEGFQYRKRYGLHAILSPEALGNSEPKRWFSNTPSLFALFPKPQGIFCRKKRLKRGAKPTIPRKLLSTKKT